MISNSIKAIIAGTGDRILIWVRKKQSKTVIRIYDNGIGLSRDLWDTEFDPLVIDPKGKLYDALKTKILDEDLAILGKGSGLGLTIVSELVRNYDGNARFIEVDKPWNTCVEVELP